MRHRITIVYNRPQPSRYDASGEAKAVYGVLDAVCAVRRSLEEVGYEVALLPLTPPVASARKKLAGLKADLAFNLFEGFCGQPESEALVPEYLENTGLAYTGCPAAALESCLDKAGVKARLKAAGIPTPDYQLLTLETIDTFRLGFPCIVKPRREDASHGITAASLVDDFASLERQVGAVAGVYGSALVEEFASGREFNATVLGDSVLPPSEIVYRLPPGTPRLLSFEAKWEPDSIYYRGTRAVCPAEITRREERAIRDTALAAFHLLGGSGYARVDMRRDKAGNLNVIEVNPNPDISPGAGAARQAAAAGMSYTMFIEKILSLALESKQYGRPSPPHDRRRQTGADADTAAHTRIQAP